MISIGIDLHVDNSFITAIDGNSGEFHDGVRIPNNNQAIKDYFKQFEGRTMKVVVEATTNTFPMVSLLRQIPDLDICVVNPRKMRIIADSVCKTDKIDSEALAEFGLSNLKLPQSFIPGQHAHDMRCQLRVRAGIVNMRTNLKLRVRSLLNGEGFFQPPKNLYGKNGRNWLDQTDLTDRARERLDSLLKLIDVLGAEIKDMDARLKKHYAKHPVWQEDVKILLTMPGIGLLSALTILAELGDWKRFSRPASVSNYAGMVPRVTSSNKKCHHGRITKQGPKYLRWILTEAAQVSVNFVPRYRTIYEKIAIKSKGGKPAATVAIARRMLEDSWIMLQKREPFKFEIKKCGPGRRA